MGRQDLEGHVAVELEVASAVDPPHATGAKRREDVVMPESPAGTERHEVGGLCHFVLILGQSSSPPSADFVAGAPGVPALPANYQASGWREPTHFGWFRGACSTPSLNHLEARPVSGRFGEGCVTGDERRIERLCEGYVHGVVRRDVLAQLQRASQEINVGVTVEIEVGEVRNRISRSVS